MREFILAKALLLSIYEGAERRMALDSRRSWYIIIYYKFGILPPERHFEPHVSTA